MTTYQAIQGQSIYDICLMKYGTPDLLYKLIQDSEISSVNEPNLSGKIFTFDPDLANDQLFANTLSTNKTIFATLSQNNDTLDGLQNDDGVNLQTDDGIQILID